MENLEKTKEQLEEYLFEELSKRPFEAYDFEFQVGCLLRELFPKEERPNLCVKRDGSSQTAILYYAIGELKRSLFVATIRVKKKVAKKHRYTGLDRYAHIGTEYAYSSVEVSFFDRDAKTLSEAFEKTKGRKAALLKEQDEKEDVYVELFKLIKENGMASNFGQLSALLKGASDRLNDYGFRSSAKFQGVYPEYARKT